MTPTLLHVREVRPDGPRLIVDWCEGKDIEDMSGWNDIVRSFPAAVFGFGGLVDDLIPMADLDAMADKPKKLVELLRRNWTGFTRSPGRSIQMND